MTDEPVVGTSKSLIKSIKAGRFGERHTSVTPEREIDEIPEQFCKRQDSLPDPGGNDTSDDDVQVGVNTSDDEYGNQSEEKGEVTSSEESSLSGEGESETDNEVSFREDVENDTSSERDNDHESEPEPEPVLEPELPELDRNDPRVQRLLAELMGEKAEQERSTTRRKEPNKAKSKAVVRRNLGVELQLLIL